jgi:phosphoribosylformylglycinamidine synthase
LTAAAADPDAGAESLHRALGLTDDEYERIVATLGREPNRAELAMYSVMWSEHCSYKSSKIHLRNLPTEGPQVLVGPGEDAGAVDIGDGLACVFKIESHSHPSAIEPFQGAATGVGGIVRDIVSMGARPIALLDPLRFGPLTEERNRWLFGGVVAGIGHYGNCIGVPTVGGEISFAEPHSANPSVNVMCVGIAPANRLVPARAEGEGNLLVLVGAATGRDGIGGVSVLASATLEEGAEENRPSVQIGDPFTEKLLIEACLELIEKDLLVGLQDLGGAGLTCAASESAARAGTGVDVDLDAVPLREEGLEAFEILTSESQERMLCIVHPSKLVDVSAVCEKWGLHAPVIGTVVPGGNLKVTSRGDVVADVPARSLADDGPVYERPMTAPVSTAAPHAPDPAKADIDLRDAFLHVLSSPNIASKRWVFEQYDSIVQHGTVKGPGSSDAAIIRIDDTRKAIALSSDGAGRYGALDPYLGAAHAVAEAARNVAVTGATPLAITNCMNFGNPERPEVMWQFAESVRGLRDACLAFDTPVTGGNVSFYNESGSSAIWPTPIVGMLGLIGDYRRAVPAAFPAEAGRAIYLLGETMSEFGGSEFAETVLGRIDGAPPSLDFEREAALHRLLVESADGALVSSAHDCSGGGLAVALAESAMAGGIGFQVWLDNDAVLTELFSESASRAIVSAGSADDAGSRLEAACERLGVPFRKIGATGGHSMKFDELFTVPLVEARDAYEGAIPRLLAG